MSIDRHDPVQAGYIEDVRAGINSYVVPASVAGL